jgi:hypothetical protein
MAYWITISWRQSREQPSPSSLLPSSHCSVEANFPSPHAERQLLVVGANPVSVNWKLEPAW